MNSAVDRLSNRTRSLEPSGIMAIFEKAQGMGDVIRLEVGEPDFDTPEHTRPQQRKLWTKDLLTILQALEYFRFAKPLQRRPSEKLEWMWIRRGKLWSQTVEVAQLR